MHNSKAPLSARLFPRGGSLLQTLFMGQSGSLGGCAHLLLLRRLLAQCERPGPAPGIKMNPSSVPPGLPPPGQQVIHVTQDLDTDLEALFNSVMNPKPSSWRKKILPESFFKEPDSGSHSRQSSTDSSGGHPGPRLAGGAQHVRSHSSPASLQLGTGAGAAGGPAQQHAHLRQQSYDVTDELPLPPGWEMTFTATGQRYFLKAVINQKPKVLRIDKDQFEGFMFLGEHQALLMTEYGEHCFLLTLVFCFVCLFVCFQDRVSLCNSSSLPGTSSNMVSGNLGLELETLGQSVRALAVFGKAACSIPSTGMGAHCLLGNQTDTHAGKAQKKKKQKTKKKNQKQKTKNKSKKTMKQNKI
ncbi:Wwtr1 [Phodopus roborovskii]|uniref:Wwtr1 protein n=1 Tax=Phodopus roborovskii TaxID=109678 RepID=A0AAU9YUS7_PHORO|nr:Wwtr1 [Phodopus roborovskii]